MDTRAMTMDILLLDLDDVLLRTHAYHDSLAEALDMISASLGFGPLRLTIDEVRGFEAAGVTAEWDSSAIVVALMLEQRARFGHTPALPYALPRPAPPAAPLPRPDILGFIDLLSMQPDTGAHPRRTAESVLRARRDGLATEAVAAILGVLQEGYDLSRSVSHRLIEELNLGSRVFSAAYGVEAWQDCEGYLGTRDQPALSQEARDRLSAWRSSPAHALCVFTNRPCARPDGKPFAPELELGLRAARLEGYPAIGLGHMIWLAELRQATHPYAYLKPSPVHALAALRRALGDPAEIAAMRAASLAEEMQVDGAWHRLEGATVFVLDDAAKGIRSAAAAQDTLAQAGIHIGVRRIGVASHAAKERALHETGARLYVDAESALVAEVFAPGN